MINAGIRHLFRKALPGVEFVSLPFMRPWVSGEQKLAKTCDLLILAGNPRYDGGEHKWLYSGVMDQMIAAGRPMVDAWQGGAVATGNGIEYDARQLLGNPRNQAIIDRLRHFSAIITRDNLAQRVNELAGLPSVQLPCSSWWAAAEYGVERVGGTDNVLIANNVKCSQSSVSATVPFAQASLVPSRLMQIRNLVDLGPDALKISGLPKVKPPSDGDRAIGQRRSRSCSAITKLSPDG
jgi:hypothetical protein